MKLFYDLLPIFAFFLVYKLYGIYPATAIIIAAVVIQVAITFLRGKKPEMMHLITLAMVVVLGGATLLFKNELFIKWKPTAVYWLLGTVFAISQTIWKKNLVQTMLEKSLSLPTEVWKALNITWVSFFYIMGILNLIVLYSFDTDTWVNFKLFGTLALTLLFVVIQGIMVARHLPNHK